MDEKNKSIKRAKTIRSEYNRSIDFVQKWLQEVEMKVQDRIVEPSQLLQIIQVDQCYI